jgi:transcriptional regulator GlxA family with amidase domain
MARTIGFLIFPQFQLVDAAGPIGAFEIASRFGGGAYDLRLLAADAGLVASSSGVSMQAEAFDAAPALDTLVISGGDGTRRPADPRLLTYVQQMAPRTRRMTSVCSGAYILAEAGLLDGRRATTHWSRSADFARRYPAVKADPDRIFIQDGPVWTSAGITAGIDLALALIAEDLGEAIARRTAEMLVVYYRRPGGQSQFSTLLAIDPGRFGGLLGWMRERLHEPLSVERLADQAAMSPRHFARAFAAETGLTPARAVERLRVEVARERVEASAEPIERIAAAAGFGDPERMRRAFVRAFGHPPQALRRAARGPV